MTEFQTKQEIAVRVLSKASQAERDALLVWLVKLLNIKDSEVSTVQKTKQALLLTKNSAVVWPMSKMLYAEVKRLGWDELSKKSRTGIAVGGAALALVGGQGAGIAALGTAIGLPLWIVLGAGAYFAAGIVEDLINHLPAQKRPQMKNGKYEIVDVEAKVKKESADG